jgi:hypothetical protein
LRKRGKGYGPELPRRNARSDPVQWLPPASDRHGPTVFRHDCPISPALAAADWLLHLKNNKCFLSS